MPILSPASSNESGFTLVEIAIVGAILSLAAAVSVPNFLQMYAKHELYQATTSLYNRLILARSSAISRNAMIAATPSSVPMGLDTVAFTAPLGPETLPDKIRFITAPPPSTTPPTLPLPVLSFTPRGLSTNPNPLGQTIQLQSTRDPNLIYSISLMPSGKVTWCRQAINPCLVNERS
ncbi:MAG: prepilin-type N-terminal cleavage/methylation domain-containing protein [Nitrospira sp.]|nr:prepilin-type N-terminal cleavage/methylation domain-containing protein [Nitrospira sp.]